MSKTSARTNPYAHKPHRLPRKSPGRWRAMLESCHVRPYEGSPQYGTKAHESPDTACTETAIFRNAVVTAQAATGCCGYHGDGWHEDLLQPRICRRADSVRVGRSPGPRSHALRPWASLPPGRAKPRTME